MPSNDTPPETIGSLHLENVVLKQDIKRLVQLSNDQVATIRHLTKMLDKIGWVMAAVGEYTETGDVDDLRI